MFDHSGWLVGVSAAALLVAAGPQGSLYDLEPMLAADDDGDGIKELYSVANGAGDYRFSFDGIAESLPAYCCGIGTIAQVSETFTDNGNGTSTVAITIRAPGADIFPGDLVTPGQGVPIVDGGLRIGFFAGSNPLDWTPAPVVTAATVNFLNGDISVVGAAVTLDPAQFFDAPQAWDGHLGVVFSGIAGLGIDRVEIRIVVANGGGTSGPCVPDATHLCLDDGRFRLATNWTTASASGAGRAVALTGDTGFFWFFAASNVELVVKVLDACAGFGHFWVFAGGLTNVETELVVEDLLTDETRTYRNPAGTPFQPVQDIEAFAGCGAQRATQRAPTASVAGGRGAGRAPAAAGVAAVEPAAAAATGEEVAAQVTARLASELAGLVARAAAGGALREVAAPTSAPTAAPIAVPTEASAVDSAWRVAVPASIRGGAAAGAPGEIGARHIDTAGATAGASASAGLPDAGRARIATATCTDSELAICLGDARFAVSAAWQKPDGSTGVGHPVRLTADTAYFWFFGSSNVELVVKVLDACSSRGRYWVFAAGLTNVGVEVTVEDTEAGGERRYVNPRGTTYQPLQDTSGFACSGALAGAWTHIDTPPGVLSLEPPVPPGGGVAKVTVAAPGASAIALTATGDGCGALQAANAVGGSLVRSGAVAAFGECELVAAVTTGGAVSTHRIVFTVEPTTLVLPPLQMVDGIFLPGDPPAATPGTPAITNVEVPQEVVSGGTAQLRLTLADPGFAAEVEAVVVKVPSAAGYNGYWEAPARREGNTVVAELRLDSEFAPSTALTRYAWRRSAADGFGTRGAFVAGSGVDTQAVAVDQPVTVAVRAGNRTTAPAAASVGTRQVDSNLVQVSLTWSTPTDVDLHVVEPPPGIEIYYGASSSPASGATLNVDSVCRGATENVTWPGAALSGEHIVRVDYYRACSHQGSTSYTVTTRVCGETKTFQGSASGEGDRGGAGSGVEITRFTPKCKFRVRGFVRYEDRTPSRGGLGPAVAKPIRYARVKVLSESGVERGKADSKQDGSFDISFELPSGETRYWVEVEARQEDALANQQVTNASGVIYKKRASELFDVTDQADRQGVEILAEKGTPGMAFNLLDNGVRAAFFYRLMYNSALGPLTWVFTPGGPSCGTLKSCMLGVNRIGIGDGPDDPDGYDDWIILHELGHSWLREKSAVQSPADPNHGEGIRADPLQAWDEGAASFFAAVVLLATDFSDTAVGGGYTWDLEEPHDLIPRGTSDGTLSGRLSEAIVAATLWDLSDRAQDGFDKADYYFVRTVFAAIGALRQSTFTAPIGVVGPDFADFLELLRQRLPAPAKVAVPDLARCQHGIPFPGAAACP